MPGRSAQLGRAPTPPPHDSAGGVPSGHQSDQAALCRGRCDPRRWQVWLPSSAGGDPAESLLLHPALPSHQSARAAMMNYPNGGGGGGG